MEAEGAAEAHEVPEPPIHRRSTRAVLKQLLLGFVANLTTLGPGMSLGFSAVALPAMQASFAEPSVNEEEASWIASLAAIATPLGCLVSGPLLDRAGRRAALLAVNAPCLLGWLLIGTAPCGPQVSHDAFLSQVYAGRILTGIATGMASVPATVYIAEVAEPRLRGALVTWTSVFISLGVLIVYVMGLFLREEWRLVALLCALFPGGAALLIGALLPESPAWLAGRGRYAEAERCLRGARGVPQGAPTPAPLRVELAAAVAAAAQLRAARQAAAGGLERARASICRPDTLKPLLILNAFFFFQQFSGVFVVIFYAVRVAEEVGVAVDLYLATVLIGATRVLVTLAVSYLSNRFGRRPLALVSGSGMTACALALAVWLRWGAGAGSVPWLPVAALLLFILTSTVGFLTLPWAMLGELFPAHARGFAGGLTTCLAYIFSFIMLKIYPDMVHQMGRDGVFFFYATVSLLGTFFVAACLPETKGRTLQEIQDRFSRSRKRPAAAPADPEEQAALHKISKMAVIVSSEKSLTGLEMKAVAAST